MITDIKRQQLVDGSCGNIINPILPPKRPCKGVYIISKVMPPHEDKQPLNCVKVGFSNMKTMEGVEKGYTRLLSFRTSLISFKVHRIYLFTASPFDAGKKEPYGLNALTVRRPCSSTIHSGSQARRRGGRGAGCGENGGPDLQAEAQGQRDLALRCKDHDARGSWI